MSAGEKAKGEKSKDGFVKSITTVRMPMHSNSLSHSGRRDIEASMKPTVRRNILLSDVDNKRKSGGFNKGSNGTEAADSADIDNGKNPVVTEVEMVTIGDENGHGVDKRWKLEHPAPGKPAVDVLTAVLDAAINKFCVEADNFATDALHDF